MGASISTTQANIQNNMMEQTLQSCPSIGAINSVEYNNVNYVEPSWCANIRPQPACTGLCINQSAMVDAQCYLSSLQQQAATEAQKLSTSAQAGLGFAIGQTVEDTQQNISTVVKQTCADQTSQNSVDFQNVNIQACVFPVVQNATVSSNCQIGATQDVISQISQAAATQAQGGSIWGDLFGNMTIGKWIAIIAAIIIILLIIGLLGYFFTRRKTTAVGIKRTTTAPTTGTTYKGPAPKTTTDIEIKKTVGGFFNLFYDSNDSQTFFDKLKANKLYMVLLILAIIIIIFLLYRANMGTNPITAQDLNNLDQSISQARHVAGLESAPVSDTSSIQYSPSIQDTYIDVYEQQPSLDDYYKPLLE